MPLQEHALYTVLARYYDYIYAQYLRDIVPKYVDATVEAFKRFARRVIREVLDVACGTGGPTLELVRRGYKVTGADLHEEMLEVAREKARKEGFNIRFVECDARELSKAFEPESFDAVTMFFTSIAYMVEWGDLIKLLKSAHHVLREGGVFVADTPNPHHFLYRLGSLGEGRVVAWTTKGPDGETLVMNDWKEVEDWVKPVIVFKREVRVMSPDGNTKSYLVNDRLRSYTALELTLAAREAGFSDAEVPCYSSRSGLQEPGPGSVCGRLFLVTVK